MCSNKETTCTVGTINHNPNKNIQELFDNDLKKCVQEIINWNSTGILTKGRIRQLCEELTNIIPANEGVILTFLRTAVFEEAAKRWLNKQNNCCK